MLHQSGHGCDVRATPEPWRNIMARSTLLALCCAQHKARSGGPLCARNVRLRQARGDAASAARDVGYRIGLTDGGTVGRRTRAFGKVHLTPEQYTLRQLNSDVPIFDWRRFAAEAVIPPHHPFEAPADSRRRPEACALCAGLLDLDFAEHCPTACPCNGHPHPAGRGAGRQRGAVGDRRSLLHRLLERRAGHRAGRAPALAVLR